MRERTLLIGTDPEFVVIGPDNRPVPAHKVGYGDKYHKTDLGMGVAFRDGFNIEINVEPTVARLTLLNRVRTTLKTVRKKLPKGYSLATLPAYRIDLRKDLEDAPPDLLTFGCDPARNAYLNDSVLCDLSATRHDERYCGAHMHFSEQGVTAHSKHWCNMYANLWAKMMDCYVGLPLTCIFHRPSQYRRRKYYGQAGEYRVQVYKKQQVGLEYRVPGPELWNDSAVADMAFGVGLWIWHNFETLVDAWDPRIEGDIQEAINTGKGRVALLRDVYGFYSGAYMKKLAREQPFFAFNFITQSPDLSSGWYAYQAENPL